MRSIFTFTFPKIILFILLIIGIKSSYSQQYSIEFSEVITKSSDQTSSAINTVKTFEFDGLSLHKYLQKETPKHLSLSINFGADEFYQFELNSSRVRVNNDSKNFHFKGHLSNNPETKVRFSVSTHKIHGIVLSKDPFTFQSQFEKTALSSKETVLFYKNKNDTSTSTCGGNSKHHSSINTVLETSNSSSSQLLKEAFSSVQLPQKGISGSKGALYCVKLGIVCNWQALAHAGSKEIFESDLEIIVNIVNAYYEEFDAEFVVSNLVYYEVAPNPWTDYTHYESNAKSFRAWAADNYPYPDNCVLLFTGQKFNGVDYAWVGYMCPTDRWRFGQIDYHYDQSTPHRANLVTHELGHLWGCPHTSSSRNYIMSPTIYGGDLQWRESSKNVINNALVRFEDCIDVCGDRIPSPKFVANRLSTCKNGAIVYTDMTKGEVIGRVWSFEGGIPSTSTDSIVTVQYDTEGNYDVSLTSTNSLGDSLVTKEEYVIILNNQSIPIMEGFESGWPTNWTVNNPDNKYKWEVNAVAGHQSQHSIVMDNTKNSKKGEIDEVILPPLDASNTNQILNMTFDLAYTQYNATSPDVLKVFASIDCGETWDEVFMKTHTELETTIVPTNKSNDWIPDSTHHWRMENIDINGYRGNESLLLKLQNISGYGTKIWVDNLNISFLTSSSSQKKVEMMQLFPNPNSGNFTVQLSNKEQSALYSVYSLSGKKIESGTITSRKKLSLKNVSKGIYFIRLQTKTAIETKKIIIK